MKTAFPPATVATAVSEPIEKGNSPWHDAWLRLGKNKLAVFAMWALTFIALVCVIGPLISAYGYEQQDLSNTFSPPGAKHWLGTDQLGRDLLVRMLYGGRVSLGVGLAATFVALTIGVVYGAVAGFFGGKLDAFMMRAVDIVYSLPFPIFVILLMVFFG